MSTTSSVAQFMALIAGTQTPTTLRAGQLATNELENTAGSFQTILSGAQSGIINGQTQNIPLTSELTSDVSSKTSSPSSIWQFITQQGANDSGAQSNMIVLNLAQQGASDTTIQEIMATFSDTEIATILQDPELKIELTNIINQVNGADGTTDTETVITALQSLVIQKQSSVEKLTFKPSDITDEIVSDIITKDIQPENKEELVIVSLETQSVILKTPIQTAQTPEAATTALQNTPEASRGLNPFMNQSEQDASPELKSVSDNVLNKTSTGIKSEYQSIADRVNAQAISHANKNVPFNAESFNAIIPGGNGSELLTDGESVIPFEAGFKTITQATNALINNASAGQSHPATQTVAMSLTKFAQTGKAGETDRYRLQLDPPEMGRLDIEMDFLDGGKVKTVIVVDKPETLAMLQKDMHALIKAMQDAGFENMSQNDLRFSLSQDNNAGDHANSKGHNGQGQQSSEMIDGDLHILESEMSVIIDPVTGQKHVNMLV